MLFTRTNSPDYTDLQIALANDAAETIMRREGVDSADPAEAEAVATIMAHVRDLLAGLKR